VKWRPTTPFVAQDSGMPLENMDKPETVVTEKGVSAV
jgi:hypothetical protein